MRKKVLFIAIILGFSMAINAQKSRVISATQLIETEKYEDAKEAIELAVWNDKTSRWPRTYYIKGLLCQTAFEAGFEKNDSKKTNLYPDQLYVAYESYEKAMELDARFKLHSVIETQYYGLANSFQKTGQRHYLNKEYSSALKAFEHALLVSKSPLLSVEVDTNLVYNTALAAYESRNWNKAINYLTGLDEDTYSPDITMLLQHAYFEAGDTIAGEEVLVEGIEKYDYQKDIVLKLVDIYVTTERWDKALTLMDEAINVKPEDFYFPWTRGLLYQSRKNYKQAISDLTRASELAPLEVNILYSLGICHYNTGVEITELARNASNNTDYMAARQQAISAFQEAVTWFEKAYEIDPGHQPTISKLYQLYHRLEMTDKQDSIEMLIR